MTSKKVRLGLGLRVVPVRCLMLWMNASTLLLNSSMLIEGTFRISPPLRVTETASLNVSAFLSSFHLGDDGTTSSESSLLTGGGTSTSAPSHFHVSLIRWLCLFTCFFFLVVFCFSLPCPVMASHVASIVSSSSWFSLFVGLYSS